MAEPAGPIMVVDHDERVRTLVGSLLTSAGFAVAEAESGENALVLAAAVRPRLALVDVFLPGLSGYEVCYRLKTEYGIPVLLVSRTERQSVDKVAASLLGADDTVAKPLLVDDLLDLVRRVLSAQEVPDDDAGSDDAGRDRDGVQERRHQS
jgi:two-component system, OmpR family, alkaline phosphatase synthesis response regulator PhoP